MWPPDSIWVSVWSVVPHGQARTVVDARRQCTRDPDSTEPAGATRGTQPRLGCAREPGATSSDDYAAVRARDALIIWAVDRDPVVPGYPFHRTNQPAIVLVRSAGNALFAWASW